MVATDRLTYYNLLSFYDNILTLITRYEQQQRRIEWRRNKVRELNVKVYGQRQIAAILHIAITTVNLDLASLRQQAKEGIARYIDEYLPAEYKACLLGLNEIMQKAWEISESADESREKLAALALAKECYGMKLDLLSSATVVDKAVKFVDLQKSKLLPLPQTPQNQEVAIDDSQKPE